MKGTTVQTGVYEISDHIYRLSTCVPEAAPGGFTFNQFLVDADHPPSSAPACGACPPQLGSSGPQRSTSVTAMTIRRLATLEPRTLALMHGSSTQTRCRESLERLADAYDLMPTRH